MKLRRLFVVVMALMLLSASFMIPTQAMDPASLPLAFSLGLDADGVAYDEVTGNDLKYEFTWLYNATAAPMTVVTEEDPNTGNYILKSDPANGKGFVGCEKSNTANYNIGYYIYNTVHTQKWGNKDGIPAYSNENYATHNLSFVWELMVRLPEMPESRVPASGTYGSGGYKLEVGPDKGYLVIAQGKGDADRTDISFEFDMKANKWYHLFLYYNEAEGCVSAYVNGKVIKVSGAETQPISRVSLSYMAHYGVTIGGGHIDNSNAAMIPAQDIAKCNLYANYLSPDSIAFDESTADIMYQALVEEGWFDNEPENIPEETEQPGESTSTPSATPDGNDSTPAATPTADSDSETDPDKTPAADKGDQGKDDGMSTVTLVMIIVIVALVVIAAGIVVGIVIVKKKKK